MARSVLGRQAWMSATPNQRAQFTQEFTTLLVHTYSSALANYKDEAVQFQPMRGDASGSRAQVNSIILRKSGPSISVNYRLILLNSQWKVYDFSVDGISMLQSFRSQFADELSQGNLDTVIQHLQQHNMQS
jgi:phospholipid transport system substrate-binding protein